MQELLPTVKHAIAVASNKGGVGKSTVAVNLAVALTQAGHKVGILDADVTGPNIPLMMGVRSGRPRTDGNRMMPVSSYGVKLMSVGFLIQNEGEPVIWRGPMIAHAVRQFLEQVEWGELDYLIIDLPPGTSDASLSLAQLVPLTGVLIVTTPSEAALADVVRGIGMFRKLNAPVLGVVENMSYFHCPRCGEETDIFGHGTGARVAENMGVPFLGELPLEPRIRVGSDTGVPVVVKTPGSPLAEPFRRLAEKVAAAVSERAPAGGAKEPPFTFTVLPSPD